MLVMSGSDFVIVGGGNAGCISALILKCSFPDKNIALIKSDNIGTVGVGESSTEHFKQFCDTCNIPILDLILSTKATFKSGVYFKNWSDEDFMHVINLDNVQQPIGHHFPYLLRHVAYNEPNYKMNIFGAWDLSLIHI